MATYDPTQAAPNFGAQQAALMRAYQSGIISLNASKGNYFAQQGLLNTGNYTTAGGDQQNFANLQVDPLQEHGGYRDELKAEADMLDASENGPDRGFSGGLANQAKATAQRAVAGRQTRYQQNLQQTLGNLNLQAGQLGNDYAANYNQIGANAADYASQQALWQGTNDTSAPAAPQTYSVPGASGGGSTPLTPQAVAMAGSFGYAVQKNPTNLKPMTTNAAGKLVPVSTGIGGIGHQT